MGNNSRLFRGRQAVALFNYRPGAGIPSINEVSKATNLIKFGGLITVNGDLGSVVIGIPEFNMENVDPPV